VRPPADGANVCSECFRAYTAEPDSKCSGDEHIELRSVNVEQPNGRNWSWMI
jgi:hypothetical protein